MGSAFADRLGLTPLRFSAVLAEADQAMPDQDRGDTAPTGDVPMTGDPPR